VDRAGSEAGGSFTHSEQTQATPTNQADICPMCCNGSRKCTTARKFAAQLLANVRTYIQTLCHYSLDLLTIDSLGFAAVGEEVMKLVGLRILMTRGGIANILNRKVMTAFTECQYSRKPSMSSHLRKKNLMCGRLEQPMVLAKRVSSSS